ncbi:MAG: UbiA family prenyltransferase [Alphaproteobacteria bacterium]|nr:UbiA family prenyltransferase [Alphaproteobacteria bacterium]MBL7096561.1 UbiA family prenyltransferase [Alphaproteobacteria bacterium]
MKPEASDDAIATIPSAGSRKSGGLLRLLSSVRWQEVIVLQGSPFFGALFSIGRLTEGKLASLALLLASSFCLLAHVFVFNDWAGIEGDLRDPYRASSVFLIRGVRRREIGYLSTALMGLGLLLLLPLGMRALAIGIGIIILSAMYSAPVLHFKGVPLISSGLHFAGGLLHFLLGYALFRAIDARGLEIGAFFALTNVAGHLAHEARDWEGDQLNGIRTNAVSFGRRSGFIASFVLFTMAYGLMTALAIQGSVPHLIVWIAALYPLHLYWTLRTLRAGLDFERVGKMQERYRVLYAMVGVIMLIGLFPSITP